MAAFGLNFCHGIGLGLHERPIISRLNSFDDPMELPELVPGEPARGC